MSILAGKVLELAGTVQGFHYGDSKDLMGLWAVHKKRG
jgi:hypothetical protein